MSILINDQTPEVVLESISAGDIITNKSGITGCVIAVHKGENCGYMVYDFYINSGKPFTEYSFNKIKLA